MLRKRRWASGQMPVLDSDKCSGHGLGYDGCYQHCLRWGQAQTQGGQIQDRQEPLPGVLCPQPSTSPPHFSPWVPRLTWNACMSVSMCEDRDQFLSLLPSPWLRIYRRAWAEGMVIELKCHPQCEIWGLWLNLLYAPGQDLEFRPKSTPGESGGKTHVWLSWPVGSFQAVYVTRRVRALQIMVCLLKLLINLHFQTECSNRNWFCPPVQKI